MKKNHYSQAFSLVELLVTLCLIGAFVAIALPMLGGNDPHPAITKANAKQVLNTYTIAKAGGVEFKSQNLSGIISELIRGVRGPDGRQYSISMPPDSIGVLANHLEFADGVLWLKGGSTTSGLAAP